MVFLELLEIENQLWCWGNSWRASETRNPWVCDLSHRKGRWFKRSDAISNFQSELPLKNESLTDRTSRIRWSGCCFFFLFVAGLIRKESHNNKGTPKNNTWIPDFVTDCSLWKRWLHLFAEKWTVEQVIRSDYMITLVSRKRILKLLISYWQWQHSIVYSSWEYTGDIRDIPGHTSNFPPFMGCTDDFLSSFYLMHFACSMGFWSIAIVRRDYINVSIAKMFNSCNDSWSKNTLTYNQHLTVTTFSKHIFLQFMGTPVDSGWYAVKHRFPTQRFEDWNLCPR